MTKKRFDIIGKPRRRVDGRAKVTGHLRYADDLFMPRMLFAKLYQRRSAFDHPCNLFGMRDTRKPYVGYRIDFWKFEFRQVI